MYIYLSIYLSICPHIINVWLDFLVAVLALDPMIGAISAGCTVVLKASEIAPATSAFFARMIPKYLDTDAIRVVEGGVPEVSALLEQKWDKIFYTGGVIFLAHLLQEYYSHLGVCFLCRGLFYQVLLRASCVEA